jgi:hypothetical protein
MKVIATAKIIAARTRFLDLPPVALLAVMVPSPKGAGWPPKDERGSWSLDPRHRHHAAVTSMISSPARARKAGNASITRPLVGRVIGFPLVPWRHR